MLLQREPRVVGADRDAHDCGIIAGSGTAGTSDAELSMADSSSQSSAARSGCSPGIRGSTSRTSPRPVPSGGDTVRVLDAARARARRRALQRPVGDHAADADARARSAPIARLWRSRLAAGDRVSASRWTSTPRPTGSSTARRTCCRRSSSTATATTSSCRRCRRGWTGCCRRSSRSSWSCCNPPAFSRRNDPRVRLLEGLEQRVERAARRRAPDDRGARGARQLRRRSVSRAEDRALPRSAREPRRGRALRARPAARRVQLQRRVRAGARAALRRGRWRSTSPRTPSRGSRVERGAQRPRPTSRRGR